MCLWFDCFACEKLFSGNLKTFLNAAISPGWRIRSNITESSAWHVSLRPRCGHGHRWRSTVLKLWWRSGPADSFLTISPVKQTLRCVWFSPGKVTLLNLIEHLCVRNEAASLCALSFCVCDPHFQFKNKTHLTPSKVLDNKQGNQPSLTLNQSSRDD